MRLKEEELGKDTESKRKALEKYFGKEVTLKDTHERWCRGYPYEADNQVYRLRLSGSGEGLQLHYHDLEILLSVPRRLESETKPVFSQRDVAELEKWVQEHIDPDAPVILPDGYTPREILEEVRRGTQRGYRPDKVVVEAVESLRKSHDH